MTRWLLLACMAAQTASAALPADYAQVIPIVTAGDSAAWQVELAAPVYAGSIDPNLRDLGVFNANGEAVPMKIQPAEYVDSITEQRSAVAVLALPQDPRSVEANDLGLIVERDAKGRLRRIETQTVSDPEPFPVTREWLLDIEDAERGIDRLKLDWDDAGQGVIAHFQLTGSNDLQRWDSLNTDATVVDLQQDGARIERRIITCPTTRLRYLRLRRLDTGVALSGLRTEASRLNRVAGIAPLQWVDATVIDHVADLKANPRLHLYSLPYSIPVSDVRVDLANDNGLADCVSPRAGRRAHRQRRHQAVTWITAADIADQFGNRVGHAATSGRWLSTGPADLPRRRQGPIRARRWQRHCALRGYPRRCSTGLTANALRQGLAALHRHLRRGTGKRRRAGLASATGAA